MAASKQPAPSRARLTQARAAQWLSAMAGRHVAVVGDVMLDEFLWGDATRISPEAPVPVVLLERQTWSLGGAANVAANVVALGGRATLFSALGDDAAGQRLRRLIAEAGIREGALPVLPGRPTTVKHRVFARNKHLLRFDWEDAAFFPDAVTRALLRALQAAGSEFDAVVVSDYAKGCVTAGLARGIGRLCQTAQIPWCVDPKLATIRYRQASVLKPNLRELELLSGMRVRNPEEMRRAAAQTLRRQGCHHVLVTLGQEGMALFAADGSVRLLHGLGQSVADVTGAGDTVSATLGLGLAAGLEVSQAATLANLAGGFVVSLPGTAVVRRQDLLGQLR